MVRSQFLEPVPTYGHDNETLNRETQSISKTKRKKTTSPTAFEMELLQCLTNKNDEENDKDLKKKI